MNDTSYNTHCATSEVISATTEYICCVCVYVYMYSMAHVMDDYQVCYFVIICVSMVIPSAHHQMIQVSTCAVTPTPANTSLPKFS